MLYGNPRFGGQKFALPYYFPIVVVCFHKQSFPHGSYSLRKISELTKIDRRVISTHMKSKEVLKNIRYKAFEFAKTSLSNYCGNYVST